MSEQEAQIIKTIGEEGEEVLMKLEEVVTLDEKDYALLTVVDKNETKDDEEKEIVIMRMYTQGDECTFELIEDDEEFNFVAQAIADDEE